MAETVQVTPGSNGQEESGTASQAQDKAKEVAGQAQEKAGQAAEQARGQIRTQVDERSTQAGKAVRTNASDVRTVAEELRKQGKETPAKLAEQTADRAERLGSYLTESDGERILRDVEDFGRRNPWAAALGGLALGFAASRLLKASSSERYRGSTGVQAPQQPRPLSTQPPVPGTTPVAETTVIPTGRVEHQV
jgi:hypothetical protein